MLLKIGPTPEIAVEVQGSGPLVVFLHGIGGSRHSWRDQLPVFAEHVTAAAWDARGYGDSDDVNGPRQFADFSLDLLRVIDHFNVEKAHLVGLSMGGRIAVDFYGRYPNRVATLVIADTSVGDPKPSPEKLQEALALRQRPLLEGKTPAENAPNVAQALIGPSTTPQTHQRIIESLSALRKESYLKTLEAVVMYHDFPPMESITVPCLALVGEEDTVAKPDIVRQMAEQIPGCEFVLIPKAAHFSNLDQPDYFNAAVLGFLKRHI